jgi:hypothetical protein
MSFALSVFALAVVFFALGMIVGVATSNDR